MSVRHASLRTLQNMKLRGLCMPLWLSSSGVYLFLESLALPCFALGPTGTAMAKLERFHQAHPDRGRVARELRNLGTFPSAERKTWATRAARVRHMCTEHLKRCESFLEKPADWISDTRSFDRFFFSEDQWTVAQGSGD